MNPESLCQWSEPKEVRTKNGPRLLRKAQITDAFRSAWRADKESCRALGLSMAPVNRDEPSGAWEAVWWQPLGRAEVERRNAAVEASRAVSADVVLPCPEGLAYLPFQRAGIALMRERPACLLCDEQGLGKTVQAIGIINCDKTVRRVLVVCPATLKVNWRNELNRWLVRPLKVSVQNSGEAWTGELVDVVIVNYDILGKFPEIFADRWDMLIADEAHFVKNRNAQRTKLLLGATRACDRERFPGVQARRRVFCTGTPILNKPIEIFPMLESLEPGKWTFRDKIRYCAGFQGKWGWDFTGAAHLDELQERLRSSIMVRRLKRDVLTDLPAKRRQIIELPANGTAGLCRDEIELYDGSDEEMEYARADMALAAAADDDEAYRQAADRLRKAAAVAFTRIAKVRHEIALAKAPKVVEHVRGILEETRKVVVFAHHLDLIEIMRAEFDADGFEPLVITGETPVDERQQIVTAFNTDPKHRALILGIRAAGVGLSVRASVEVFAELDWVPGVIAQAEDRCHGIGRGIEGEPLLVQHLVLEGSLDARMVKTVIAKQEIADAALDKAFAMLEVQEPVTKAGADLPGRAQIARDAETLTAEMVAAVHRGLQILAGVCDGAFQRDGCGFNGCDARIGHSLAGQAHLSNRQAALGRRILMKYSRQLPGEVMAIIKGKD